MACGKSDVGRYSKLAQKIKDGNFIKANHAIFKHTLRKSTIANYR